MKLVFQLNSNALLLPTYVTYVVVMPFSSSAPRRRQPAGAGSCRASR